MQGKADKSGAMPWLLPIAVAGCAVLGIGASVATKASNNATQSAIVQAVPTRTEATISAIGRLEPESEVLKVAPPSALGSSRIVKLLVKEGDRVALAQPLAILDSYDRSAIAVKQAEAKVAEREAILAQVQAGAKQGDIDSQRASILSRKATLARQRVELQQAQTDLDRYDKLMASGATSAFNRDTFALKVDSLTQQVAQSKADIAQAEAQLLSVSEVRSTDVAVAQAQLQTARADLERAKADLDLAEVRAPIAGQILKVRAKAGEAVSMGDGVLEMGKTDRMYAVAEVYETAIGRVKVGQKAWIDSEVFRGEISGKVERIGLRIAKNDVTGTDPATRTDVRVVEVRIRLDDSTKISGLTNLQVKVRIKTDTEKSNQANNQSS